MKNKILIVDDNSDIRMVVRDAVELFGFDTVEADTANSGLMIYLDNKKDVYAVITDDDMEVVGAGVDMIHSIIEVENVTSTPSCIKILMSGRHENIEHRARAVGAVPLRKPFHLSELKKILGSPAQKLQVA